MKHLPWILLALVLAYPLFAQGAQKRQSLRGPVKVFGIPHPDEWIEIKSNELGQPATTYTVPPGHRLTLRAVFFDTNIQDANASPGKMVGRILVDGTQLGPGFGLYTWGESSRILNSTPEGGPTGETTPTFAPGTVVMADQVMEIERTDPGDGVSDVFAEEDRVFVVRGFLEKVD